MALCICPACIGFGGEWDGLGWLAFVALAQLGPESKYWMFVLGFVMGAYMNILARYAVAMSLLFGLIEETFQSYFIFLQAGILAGILARGL